MFPVLVILIFIRPFLASIAFFWSNLLYSVVLLGFLSVWILYRGLSFNAIKPFALGIIFLITALTLSVVFSLNYHKSASQIYNYLIYILTFLVILCLTHKEKEMVFNILVAASIIIGFLAIYNYLFGFKHVLHYMSKYDIFYSFGSDYIMRKRVFFPFVTPNALGGFLAMFIIFVLQEKRSRLFLAIISLALFLTKSLGAIISLFVGIILFLYFTEKIDRKKFIAISILLLTLFILFILRSQVPQEILRPQYSFSKRLDYWRATFVLIKTYPLTGVGLGNFNIALSRFAHNSFLQFWAETGTIGIFALLWFIISHLRLLFRNLKTAKNKKLAAAFLASNIIFLLHNFFDFTFFLPEICLTWWVILGLSIDKDR